MDAIQRNRVKVSKKILEKMSKSSRVEKNWKNLRRCFDRLSSPLHIFAQLKLSSISIPPKVVACYCQIAKSKVCAKNFGISDGKTFFTVDRLSSKDVLNSFTLQIQEPMSYFFRVA